MDLSVGTIHEGTVNRITEFGAFVSLAEGKVGLLHISEIANSYVRDVREFLSEGQLVKVKVIEVDEIGRMKLSIKKAEPPPRQEAPIRKFSASPKRTEQRADSSFEDRLKQFMQESDSKMSKLRSCEKRGKSRRIRRGT